MKSHRIVQSGVVVFDQVDIVNPAWSNNRINGLTIESVDVTVFINNKRKYMQIVDGSTVLDQFITTNSIYFNEINGSPGYYSVRFFSDSVGFMRVILSVKPNASEHILSYDIVAKQVSDTTEFFSHFC